MRSQWAALWDKFGEECAPLRIFVVRTRTTGISIDIDTH